ncbi:MAG: hypothetical protein GY942_23015, partial [Aestuariibacter sp.]|nr:hypothetical protein [Aestuariibacter sp.]
MTKLTDSLANDVSRRSLLKQLVVGVTGATLSGNALAQLGNVKPSGPLKGAVNHSVSRWTY